MQDPPRGSSHRLSDIADRQALAEAKLKQLVPSHVRRRRPRSSRARDAVAPPRAAGSLPTRGQTPATVAGRRHAAARETPTRAASFSCAVVAARSVGRRCGRRRTATRETRRPPWSSALPRAPPSFMSSTNTSCTASSTACVRPPARPSRQQIRPHRRSIQRRKAFPCRGVTASAASRIMVQQVEGESLTSS